MKYIISIFALFLASSWAHAIPTFYTNQADFLAAAGAVNLEDFESEATGDKAQTYTTASGLVFTTSGSTGNEVRDVSGVFGTHNTTVGGRRFLESDSHVPSFHDPVGFSHTGGTLSAWGAFFTDMDFGSIEFLADGVSVATPTPGADGGTLFFGFVGPMDFIEIRAVTDDRTWGVDDVYWSVASVPEPATLALILLGLTGISFARKKA